MLTMACMKEKREGGALREEEFDKQQSAFQLEQGSSGNRLYLVNMSVCGKLYRLAGS